MAAEHNETNRKDLECSVCLELLCEPMQLPCSHVFCRRCLAGVLRQSRHCALCRASIPEDFDPVVAPLHRPLEQIMMRQCTVEYMQRMEDVALEAAHLVRLRIGNKYELLGIYPRPRHQWTVEVELEAQPESCLPRGSELPNIIKHIRFAPPPACKVVNVGQCTGLEADTAQAFNEGLSKYVEVTDGPYQVTATSPMACTIPLIITWQDWLAQPPLRLEHSLDFNRDGGCWDYGVDLHAALGGTTENNSEERLNSVALLQHQGRLLDGPPAAASMDDHMRFEEAMDGSAAQIQGTRKSASMFSKALTKVRRHLPKVGRRIASSAA